MVWNCTCANNLAVYLPRLFEVPARKPKGFRLPKAAIFAKGCDARSAVGHLKESQVPRENLFIIGVPCQGMVDTAKVLSALGGAAPVSCEELPDGMLDVLTASGGRETLRRDDVLYEGCVECRHPVMEEADMRVEGDAKSTSGSPYESMRRLDSLSSGERWQAFMAEMAKCIRCNACRQACPNCYCPVCFADQGKPRWVGAGDALSDKAMFHIGRILHQTGRCVECDACVRACPMGLDLRPYTQKVVKDVADMFGYVAGLSLDGPPPLTTFDKSDFDGCGPDPSQGGGSARSQGATAADDTPADTGTI